MNVKEVMTADPACCTSDMSLQEAAKLMVDNDCGCIPIVDNIDSKKPVGMITDRDITIRTVAEGKNPLELRVSDAMTANAITVTAQTSLEECCNLMESNQVRRVAVVDENGSCCGIIAQADIAVNGDQRKTAEVVQEVSRSTAA
ncbi:MAG: CBS domain-containing protein [Pyrinomonadaceae bacterium]